MYDQLSLLGSQAATSAPETQPAADTAPAVRYYPINEETARQANNANSMRDYLPGSATAEYHAAVDKAAALVADKKQHTSPFYHGKLDAYLDSYAKRLAEYYNAYYRNEASCPSVLISGGSNFPVNKKNKQNARRDSLWQEYQQIEAILDKIKGIGTGPVDLADPHARQILTSQLTAYEKELEDCKAANAYYRKHKTLDGCPGIRAKDLDWLTRSGVFNAGANGTPLELYGCPFPAYHLQSVRGYIKRVQARLAELDKLEAARANPDPAADYDGFQLIRNAAENRLQIIFDEIPDPDMREKLKSNGFRWSPRNQAWQRQLTDNAERAAKSILGIE